MPGAATVWHDPTTVSPPLDGEIHVWRTSLEWPADRAGALAGLLSPHERERAAQFRTATDRGRFTIARGLLRLLLGGYLRLPPDQLRFQYGAHGKPALADGLDARPLRFNVSHSGGLILIAVAHDRSVGIDVEEMRNDIDWRGIAAAHFSQEERQALAAAPSDQRLDAFYACWTRKEAYVKAREDGLSLALDSFTVDVAPGRPAQRLTDRRVPGKVACWSLWDLDAGRGYRAALAVEGASCRVRCWEWPAGQTRLPE